MLCSPHSTVIANDSVIGLMDWQCNVIIGRWLKLGNGSVLLKEVGHCGCIPGDLVLSYVLFLWFLSAPKLTSFSNMKAQMTCWVPSRRRDQGVSFPDSHQCTCSEEGVRRSFMQLQLSRRFSKVSSWYHSLWSFYSEPRTLCPLWQYIY